MDNLSAPADMNDLGRQHTCSWKTTTLMKYGKQFPYVFLNAIIS
ncbi:MAG TPA: hypothetical protein VFF11_10910 [Candidatus Binatia bacterium]|nr:hypothetical protein [Candidatus Binatia bacterium]